MDEGFLTASRNPTRSLPRESGEGRRNRVGQINVKIHECGRGAAGGLVCGIA
jgi:hypothetical protein